MRYLVRRFRSVNKGSVLRSIKGRRSLRLGRNWRSGPHHKLLFLRSIKIPAVREGSSITCLQPAAITYRRSKQEPVVFRCFSWSGPHQSTNPPVDPPDPCSPVPLTLDPVGPVSIIQLTSNRTLCRPGKWPSRRGRNGGDSAGNQLTGLRVAATRVGFIMLGMYLCTYLSIHTCSVISVFVPLSIP